MSEQQTVEKGRREQAIGWTVAVLRSYGIEEHRCHEIAEALIDEGLVR